MDDLLCWLSAVVQIRFYPNIRRFLFLLQSFSEPPALPEVFLYKKNDAGKSNVILYSFYGYTGLGISVAQTA